MKYRIKGWLNYQHYKDRCPPWIKLHHALLTSEVWVMGTDATRALAIASMLLAARNESNDGTFNGDPEYVKRFAYLNTKPCFKQLIEYDFIEVVQDASNPLAECDTEQSRAEQSRADTLASFPCFSLPTWIDTAQWDLWMKTRKGKKMTVDQMKANIAKLQRWRESGLDHCGALADAAAGGWQGLHEPKKKAPNSEQYGLGNYV